MSAHAQRSRLFVRLIFSLALLLGALFVFYNRQQLLDQAIVWQFKPTSAISALASESQLSERGKFLFYASQPELQSRNNFNDSCRSIATEQTAVLGCYSGNRIYLFDINNEKLAGIKQVTAAHEMLHAAYQRLSTSERKRIDGLLDRQSLGTDGARISELMAAYEKTEPGERLNELHSILGSEVRNLDPELETYYKQYFSNRAQLVTLSEQYQTVFTELKSRQESLVSELTALADTIDGDGAVYKRNLQVLDNDIERFNSEARSGTMTREEYDAQRAVLESRQASLKRDYDTIQGLVDVYEQKRAELASINTESNALNRSINSSLTPVSDSIDG